MSDGGNILIGIESETSAGNDGKSDLRGIMVRGNQSPSWNSFAYLNGEGRHIVKFEYLQILTNKTLNYVHGSLANEGNILLGECRSGNFAMSSPVNFVCSNKVYAKPFEGAVPFYRLDEAEAGAQNLLHTNGRSE